MYEPEIKIKTIITLLPPFLPQLRASGTKVNVYLYDIRNWFLIINNKLYAVDRYVRIQRNVET